MEPGTYKAKPIAAKYGKSGTGIHQIGVRLEITDGEFAGESRVWYGSFTPKAEKLTFQAMEAMGYTGGNPLDLSCLTEPVSIVVDYEEYNGEERLKVKFVNRLGGITMKEDLSAADAQSFADHFKGGYAMYKAGDGSGGSAGPTEHDPPPISDDDIPF